MARTDRNLAERAMEKANEKSTKPYRLISLLCPVCNEPYFGEDPNPNDFVHDPDVGEYGLDRSAFQISPARLLEREPDNPWDRICVYPEIVQYDDGEHQRVAYARHDFSEEHYRAWKRELKELKQVERRREENVELDAYEDGRIRNDRHVCPECTGETTLVEGKYRSCVDCEWFAKKEVIDDA